MSVKLGSTTKEVIDQINTNEKNKYEAYLNWGGKHLVGKYSPIDANLNMYLSPNRLAGMNVAGITIEYSNDGGSTWVDYGASDALKGGLVTSSGTIKIGGSSKTAGSVTANDMLRVTLDGVDGGVYTAINKVHIWVTTNGSQNCTVSLESYDYNSSTEWHSVISNQSITGWSAWNVLNFTLPGSGAFGGTNNARHQRKIRFTFKHSGCSSSYTGLNISRLYAYGGMGWSAPSNMALFGTPYSYDYASNVSFPANLNAKSISEGGALLSNKYLGISAKASDSAKLNGQEASYYLNYNNFTNKPTLSSFGITATATELNVLDGITATTTELNYTDGVTSNIQTQLNGKQASLSTTQLNAVNSGITSSKVSTYDGYASTLNGKLSLSGGTMTGNLKWSSSTALPEITSPKYFLSIDSFADGGTTKWVTLANAKSALGVPTNYAGSSSAGGSATSAVKLDSSAVGSATQPVYFSGGKPVATTYTLGASVPSNAKFTDTTYDVATTSANGLMSSTDKSKLDGIASGANKTTVDSAMSSTSTNPVQNKVVNSAISAKYTKPSTGIPKSDLASDVQTSLGKADSALQSHQSLANYVTLNSAQEITGSKTFKNAHTFTGETKFTNASYAPTYKDNADGVGKAGLFSRGSFDQAIIGQVIAPNQTFTDENYGYSSESGKIKFQRITNTGGGAKIVLEDMAVLSADGMTIGSKTVATTDQIPTLDTSKHSTTLLQGTNLNTLYGADKVGWYYGATTTGMSNYPISSTTGFGLEVGVNGNNYYYQRFITSNGVTYVRITYNGSNWGNWVRVAMYDDLVQVNNGKLTIQKNGTTIGTFTANQIGDTTVNLTVGSGSSSTQVLELSGDESFYLFNVGELGVATFTGYMNTCKINIQTFSNTSSDPVETFSYSATSGGGPFEVIVTRYNLTTNISVLIRVGYSLSNKTLTESSSYKVRISLEETTESSYNMNGILVKHTL